MSVINVNKNIFENEILKSEKPVLLDFYADWCGPCQMIAPIIHELADEHPEYIFGKINVDENMDLAQLFGVVSIPMLAVIKNGKMVNQTVGLTGKEEILKMLEG